MARFLTRVELHGAKHDDDSYKTLHAEMVKRKFSMTIATDKGVKHRPTAEYYSFGELKARDVSDLALEAVSKTGKTASTIVVEMVTFHANGLLPTATA